MSKVGIVMTAYNGMAYVGEQIESILSNSYTDWELYIYDDGSSDDTVSILRNYEKQYPGKIYVNVNEKNLGVTRNFLEGIQKCDCEYIMLCDQDDVWMKEKIEKTLNKMTQEEKHHDSGYPVVVYSDATVVDGELNTIHPSFHKSSRLDVKKVDLSHLLMENKLIGCTIMLNQGIKRLLTKLPISARVHDWWIGLVATCFGGIYYLDEPTLLYRQHENNVIGNKGFMTYVHSRIRNIKEQRIILNRTRIQAQEFYTIYSENLSQKNREILYKFAHIHEENWVTRRVLLWKMGYTKSGVLRNIGVFLLI